MSDRKRVLSDDDIGLVSGGVDDGGFNPLACGCDSWTCAKCGAGITKQRFHICDSFITKTVCEYCQHYKGGKCLIGCTPE